MLIRPRRLRRTAAVRDMVRETKVSPDDFIAPLFVAHGRGIKEPIASLPGQFRFSPDTVSEEVKEIHALGIPSVILFGLPDSKDESGSRSWADDGVVQMAIKKIKDKVPSMVVITDVCLCEYTSHGHCGILKGETVDNDETIELLARQAVSHAKAGADMVAPSDMMDGRIGAVRQELDTEGYQDTAVMAYSAKYASGFYGPFRDAADSAPQFGDRSSYQMDPANAREALREIRLDIEEGADIVMVKPALAYLDIIRAARQETLLPLAAYNVSGEYAMVKAAARNGWIDGKRVMLEILTAIRRAGADIILTYFAKEAARELRA
ncbi:MAG: porphobilinogen synthase [Deltaproteobacteria bacterium CG_4_8_14_3_um_filter_51_11]|nr:porphobilinogen synthase [bacterium]OIP38219.1 MAG: delta-aminolevulinic acid dehydratase [Desulfobacteraceae bacterium CG2_30_51_40]PIP46764.1 MAG: porphobilinogen synthase [Deltaproteobacteria bacterium CG23_combo_of_CG06-09_8_20_14_all_51_20]PIV99123.1 MAG: porphobilinogen synthase [Deltaproteobacteria bacterium CG17_big_fil_post_rev_8_21_14_2_50_51_6]PIX19574.1 MAG: porphobilinogen synthase [Deltaproteobacteria bacterium CG_4_8_14_3_um_filter_51_11]PIY22208.1 MAG: porphobilinogen syntha